MPDGPNKLPRFWQELKRRNVVQVVFVYAASAFAVLEAADIIFPRIGLPDWSVNVILYLLAFGFILTIILSWVYDITPQGLTVTESLKADRKDESDESVTLASETRVWRLSTYISILVILFFVVLRFIEKDRGNKGNDLNLKSIAVMPFINISNDTLFNVWQTGIQHLLINKLSGSRELTIHEPQTMFDLLESTDNLDFASISTSIAGDLATRLNSTIFIFGTITKSKERIRIGAQMRDSYTREITRSFEIDASSEEDFFVLTDSLSDMIKDYLEVEVYEKEVEIVLHSSTGSAEAYRYYIQGTEYFWLLDYASSIPHFIKAIETDPDFHLAYIHLSLAYYNMHVYEKGKKIFAEGYSRIEHMSLLLKEQLAYNAMKAWIDKDPDEMIKQTKMLLDINPFVRYNWFTVGLGYELQWNIREAIKAYENCLSIDEQWGGHWKWNLFYTKLGMAYHIAGKHRKEREIYKLGLSILPDNQLIIENQIICALSRNRSGEADRLLKKLLKLYEIEGRSQAEIYAALGMFYSYSKDLEASRMYYQNAIEADTMLAVAYNNLAYDLIDNDIDILTGMQYVDRALEIEPDNGLYLDTRGWGYYKLGMYEEAAQCFKLAIENTYLYYHAIQKHLEQAELKCEK